MQEFFVALLVIFCFGYAIWALMPRQPRRALAIRLLQWPWPNVIGQRLQKAAMPANACGCDGCDKSPVSQQRNANAAASQKVVVFHPRRR